MSIEKWGLSLLRIHLLGTFQLSYRDELIETFRNAPRLQSLLAYLLLHPETPHSRNDLATLFWPASATTQARTNLRKLLYQLRHALPDPTLFLWQNRNQIGWKHDAAYSLDVADLQQLFLQSSQQPNGVHSLQKATALYQGSLLPTVYDSWVNPLRQQLQTNIVDALKRLILWYYQQEAFGEALQYAQQLLDLDPYSETAYQWVIRLHGESGARIKAIQAYQACVAMLRDELAVQPTAETAALYRQLLENKPAPQPPRRNGAESVASPLPSFVGRKRELDWLNQLLTTAVSGQSQLLFVSGDSGRGKTTLVTEFARRAEAIYPDLLVAIGACDAYTGVGDPYLPFRDLFSLLSGDLSAGGQTNQLSTLQAKRLQAALPDVVDALLSRGTALLNVMVDPAALADRAAAAPLAANKVRRLQNSAAAHSAESQTHLFEQCVNVLRQLAQKRPLLLILDDLQWADRASLSLLFHLGRRFAGSRLLIIGTFRPVEVGQSRAGQPHPLSAMLDEFRRLLGDILLELDQIPPVEAEAFVNELLDQMPNRLGESFRQTLFGLTAGHPLYTTELLRDMQERDALIQDDKGHWIDSPSLDWQKIPARVEGVIAGRVNRLDDNLRQTLDMACIQGENFTAEVVAHIRELPDHNLNRQLSGELVRRHHLLLENGRTHLGQQRLSFYTFRHSLFQQFLYSKLGGAERAYLHEAVGTALETIYGDFKKRVAAQCARHFELAGNREKKIEFLLLAAERALEQYANQEALTHFSKALNLLPQDDAERRFACLLNREKIYHLLGNREHQRQDLAQLQALAKSMADPLRQATVTLRHARFAAAHGELPVAIKAAQKTVQLAQRAGDTKLEAAGLYQWGKALWRKEENVAAARDQIEQALMLAHQEQISLSGATTLFNLSVMQKVARIQLERALATAQKAEAEQIEADSLYTLGAVTLILGDWAAAKSSYEEALVKHRTLGNLSGEAHCLSSLGVLLLIVEKHPEQAAAYHQEALDLYRAMGYRQNEAAALSHLADVATFQKGYAQARVYRERALAICREIDARHEAGYCLKALGSLALQQGEYDQAARQLREALAMFHELDDLRGERMTLVELGVLWRTLGDYKEAHSVFKAALALYKAAGLREGQSRVLSEMGLLAHQQGDYEAARQLCETAVFQLRQTNGSPKLLAVALTHYGYALLEQKAPDKAIASFAEAGELLLTEQKTALPVEQIVGQAQGLLAQGHAKRALHLISEILDGLTERQLCGASLPGQLLLTCLQILQVTEAPQAAKLDQTAQTWLENRMHHIEGGALRHAFLQAVPAHQALTAVYDSNY